jgi:hypothetical protein
MDVAIPSRVKMLAPVFSKDVLISTSTNSEYGSIKVGV